jgi:hypothetical protein
MFTVKLNKRTEIMLPSELLEHYKTHSVFDEYDADADEQLDKFWSKFNDILFTYDPDFENKYDVSELIEELECMI